MKDNLEAFDPRFQPKVLGRKWTPGFSERPDLIVKDLSKSLVLEVRASELLASNNYLASGYTLRFPRVVKIRYDKDWKEAMTKDDLDTMIADFGNRQRLMADSSTRKRKLAEVYESGSESERRDDLEQLMRMENPKKKRLRKSEAAAETGLDKTKFKFKSKVVEYFREAEVDVTELHGVASSDMFTGMEFYIVNTDE